MASLDSTSPVVKPPFPDPIPDIMPFGTLTVFAGAPGAGKTAMLAEWCARWRDGRTICGKPTHPPTRFCYIAGDRQWASHQRWFDLAGFPDIPHYSLADDDHYNLDALADPQIAAKLFEHCLGKVSPIPGAHIFIDPAVPLFISGNPNWVRDVAVTLLRFSRICRQRQFNLTITAHFAKQRADPKDAYLRPQDRIAGSGAFSGFSDTQLYLTFPIPPEQPYHALGWVPRHQPEEEFHFVRGENGLFVPHNLFSDLDRQQQVLACIPEQPTEAAAVLAKIQQICKLSIPQAERYLRALVRDGFVIRVRRGIYKRGKPN